MEKKQIKLFTWNQYLASFIATFVGVGVVFIDQYKKTGTISTVSIIATIFTLFIGVSIILTVGWYANKPEKE